MIVFAPTLLLLASLPLHSAVGQEPGPVRSGTLTFRMDRPGLPVPLYVIRVGPGNRGVYWEGSNALDATAVASDSLRTIIVSLPTAGLLFASVPAVQARQCETKAKHIAQTGRKTLLYTSAEEKPSCDFNYSDDERLNAASSAFQAIASTLQIGDQLKHLQRYDRLGLDTEMDTLIGDVKDHRALEVQNIAAVLQSIAQDDRVMERVRRKAVRLLQDAGVAASFPDASASAR